MANLVAFAGDANQMKYVTLGTFATSGTGAAVDVSDYKGNSIVIANWAAGGVTGGTYTGTVTFTTSATSGGTYTTVTNLAGTAGVFTRTGSNVLAKASTFQIDSARLNKYVKATVANVNLTNAVSVLFVAPMKAD